MKIMYHVLIALLISAVAAVFVFKKLPKNNSETTIAPNTPQDLIFIKENYDALITSQQSPSLMRAIHENCFACYYA